MSLESTTLNSKPNPAQSLNKMKNKGGKPVSSQKLVHSFLLFLSFPGSDILMPQPQPQTQRSQLAMNNADPSSDPPPSKRYIWKTPPELEARNPYTYSDRHDASQAFSQPPRQDLPEHGTD
ncbi:MAG TPA: hypothetical protein VGO47_03565, partial [Chlamydiales bacterium]|nr:hypothetical protein [Chlamydiales bacterium]